MKRKPEYIEGEEANERFDVLMQGVLRVKPEDLKARLDDAKLAKDQELCTDRKGVSDGENATMQDK